MKYIQNNITYIHKLQKYTYTEVYSIYSTVYISIYIVPTALCVTHIQTEDITKYNRGEEMK